jgi:tetratricopeptide (TPR) repeat protein
LTEAYFNRGVLYDYLGEYDNAILNYDRVISINQNHADAYSNRGLAYFNLKDYKKAIQSYSRAI